MLVQCVNWNRVCNSLRNVGGGVSKIEINRVSAFFNQAIGRLYCASCWGDGWEGPRESTAWRLCDHWPSHEDNRHLSKLTVQPCIWSCLEFSESLHHHHHNSIYWVLTMDQVPRIFQLFSHLILITTQLDKYPLLSRLQMRKLSCRGATKQVQSHFEVFKICFNAMALRNKSKE